MPVSPTAPAPDFLGFAQMFNPIKDYASDTIALDQANQSGIQRQQLMAQKTAGQLMASGDYAGAARALYGSGDLQNGQAATNRGAAITGATALANRQYGAAAQAAGSVGDAAGVTAAQGAGYQQFQLQQGYVQQALPTLQAAYSKNGAGGVVHGLDMLAPDLAQIGVTPAQISAYKQQAAADPEAFLSNLQRFTRVQWQKINDNTSIPVSPVTGQPVGAPVTGQTQTVVAPGSNLVTTAPSGFGGGAPMASTNSIAAPANGNTVGASPSPANNPGNIRNVNGQGFQSFPTPAAGVQAIDTLLQNYGSGPNPVTTLRGVISKYAPPNENATAQLIAAAASRTGIDPDAPINLQDPAVRQAIINKAILPQEQGGTGATPAGSALAQPSGPSVTSPQPGTTVMNPLGDQPLYRDATPQELASTPYVYAKVDRATGALSSQVMRNAVSTLTPDSIQTLGDRLFLTGQMPDIGRSSNEARDQLQNYVTQRMKAEGLSAGDLATQQQRVTTAQSTYDTMSKQKDQLATAEANALDNAKQVETLLPKAAATYGIRTLAELQQAIRRNSADPNLAALDTAYKDFNGDYSKVMFSNANGNGGSGGVGEREEAREFFSPNDTIQVALAKLGQAKIGMGYRTQEFKNTLQQLQYTARTGQLPPSSSSGPAKVTNDADFTALPSGAHFVGPDGQLRVKP